MQAAGRRQWVRKEAQRILDHWMGKLERVVDDPACRKLPGQQRPGSWRTLTATDLAFVHPVIVLSPVPDQIAREIWVESVTASSRLTESCRNPGLRA